MTTVCTAVRTNTMNYSITRKTGTTRTTCSSPSTTPMTTLTHCTCTSTDAWRTCTETARIFVPQLWWHIAHSWLKSWALWSHPSAWTSMAHSLLFASPFSSTPSSCLSPSSSSTSSRPLSSTTRRTWQTTCAAPLQKRVRTPWTPSPPLTVHGECLGLHYECVDVADSFTRCDLPFLLARVSNRYFNMTEIEGAKVSPNQTLWPMCCSLTMGLSWSVYFTQSSNRTRLNRQPSLRCSVHVARVHVLYMKARKISRKAVLCYTKIPLVLVELLGLSSTSSSSKPFLP